MSAARRTCTCAGVTADVALHADVAVGLVEALWAAFHAEFGALQLQEWRGTQPARGRTGSGAHLARRVALLAVGAVSVIPADEQTEALFTPG